MNLFEEETIASLETLFINVSELSQISIRDILKPDVYFHYERTLQEAYDALTKVEDTLTALGMKLEYQHYRLGGALDELKPLLIKTLSPSDTIMKDLEKRLPTYLPQEQRKRLTPVGKEERQKKLLERFGFVQMMFDFYMAPVV